MIGKVWKNFAYLGFLSLFLIFTASGSRGQNCPNVFDATKDSLTIEVGDISVVADDTEEWSKLVTCVDIRKPGLYRIKAYVRYSGSAQTEESFYLEIFKGSQTIPNREAEEGIYKVVEDDGVSGYKNQDAGLFFLGEGDDYTIWLNHYAKLKNELLDNSNSVHLESLELVTEPNSCNLSLTKKSEPNKVRPNDIISYTLNLENQGPNTAFNVFLKDALPKSVRLLPSNADRVSANEDTLFWDFDMLPPGSDTLLTYTVKVAGEEAFQSLPDTLVNKSVVTSDCGKDSTSFQVVVDNPKYDLKLTKTAIPYKVEKQPINYTLEIVNFGPDTVRSYEVWDDFDNSVIFLDFSVEPEDRSAPDTLHWEFTSALAPRDTAYIRYRGACPSGIKQPLEIINTAWVASKFDTIPANNSDTSSVICFPDPPEEKVFRLDRSVFEPETQPDDLRIIVQTKSEMAISLQIVDITGYIIRTFPEAAVIWRKEFTWDGKTDTNQRAASGVYLIICRGKTPNGKTMEDFQKVIVVR